MSELGLSICIFSRSVPPFEYGGIETYTRQLSEKLVQLGCDVTLICKKPVFTMKNYVELNGVKIHFITADLIPSTSFQNILYSMLALKKSLQIGSFDIYHGQYIYGFGCALAKMQHIIKKPFVNTVHNLILRDMKLPLSSFASKTGSFRIPPRSLAETFMQAPLALAETKLICKQANKTIAVSENTKKDCVDFCNIPGTKVNVIPNGVDIERFNPRVSGGQMREILGVKSDPLVLYVGGLDARKGLDCLAFASKNVLKTVRETKFLIVGRGPREAHLKMLLRKLQVIDSFIFLPNVTDVNLPSIYAAADVFVLPSFWEGFGISLTEAMSTGLPVVSSNVSALPEIILNNENGFLAEPGDYVQLAERITTLLLDKALSRRFGLNARKTMEERYSWDIIARRTMQVYNTF